MTWNFEVNLETWRLEEISEIWKQFTSEKRDEAAEKTNQFWCDDLRLFEELKISQTLLDGACKIR